MPSYREKLELRSALREMMLAYERRIRSLCTPEEIAKEPWRCAEYIEAERLLKLPPFKLLMSNEQLRRKIASDPDCETEAGPPLFG